MKAWRMAAGGSALFLTVLTLQCSAGSKPAEKGATLGSELTPFFSVKELMQNIIDPQADLIFESVAVDVDARGVVETKPTSDDDWLKVQRGAVILIEGSNLLKMPRRIAPDGETGPAAGGPELTPQQIQAKLDSNRPMWNSHVDRLREEAFKVLDVVKARDSEKLFEVGSGIDEACEACHLEYWYPGDKAAVEKDRTSHVSTSPGDSTPTEKALLKPHGEEP